MQEYDTLPKVSFGVAIEAAKDGRRVARVGWNGKGMWLTIWPGGYFDEQDFLFSRTPQLRAFAAGMHTVGTPALRVEPCFVMKTAANTLVFGWLASQSDLLAEDWVILPDLGDAPQAA